MKTKVTSAKKTESMNEKLREIRDKVSMDIKDMDHKQLQKYLRSKKSIFPASAWEKK